MILDERKTKQILNEQDKMFSKYKLSTEERALIIKLSDMHYQAIMNIRAEKIVRGK